jgi:hypothetical protein
MPQSSPHVVDPIIVDPVWVKSLPEYTGPTKIHALQIQHIERYGQAGAPRDRTGAKKPVHQSLASPSPSLAAKGLSPASRPAPEDLGDLAAGRITPVDQSYAPFEVDEAYLRENKPHTGGYYIVFETGAEGFEAPEKFLQQYTKVVNPEDEKAAAERDEQAAKAREKAEKAAAKADEKAKK